MKLLSLRNARGSLDPYQELQYTAMKTILPNILSMYCNPSENIGKVKDYITDATLYYLGNPDDEFFKKVALPMIVINRYFVASTGPRIGGLLEDIILQLLNEKG